MQKSVLALAVLATASLPALAESVDVRVTGTITPVACTPTIAGGGTIDYGTIDPASISDTDYTVLPEKQVDFSIACDAPAKIAIKAINGRPNTLAGATEGVSGGKAPVVIFGSSNIHAFGLGLDGTARIGGYGIRLAKGTVQADGTAADSIYRNTPTDAWVSTSGTGVGSLINAPSVRHVSWAAAGKVEPVAFTNMTGKLGVQAYINKGSELDLSKPVTLDGLTTIELVYI
ncbi:DUF1120 domain-containing protein [Enterobacter bugandensis]|uniref:DUF1120 domain-containing protein n=1 Tax=Enterobacter bugandensis TaxID=881260 RepID=UPI002DBAD5F9|nr:DUF1120 domain-containing protein [Enterobacter bugandensis]WRU09481.1 DUF1120 domain-containing protein [Enterobacter bugandensis]